MVKASRRDPKSRSPQPNDADEFRAAWSTIERLWAETIKSARGLTEDQLHERVNGEWSFIETLRHLLFVTDGWVRRAVLSVQAPYDQLDLPHTAMKDDPIVPRDLDARPSLDEVLALRVGRMAVVREVMAHLSNEELTGTTDRLPAPGYPRAGRYPVRRCLQAVVSEEWYHRLYAERDLGVLWSRSRA